jgi:hypothetical protein
VSLAEHVFDFYDDHDHGIMAKLSLPAEIADLELEPLSETDRDRLGDDAFGLVMITKQGSVLRRFPVCDPGHSWLAAQYFDAHHEKLALPARFVAAHFIKEACRAYGVPAAPMVEAYAARAEPADVEKNAYVEGSEGGFLLRKLAQRELLEKQAAATEVDALLAMPDGHFALVVETGDGEVIRKYAMPDAEHVKIAAAYFDEYAMALHPEHRHRFASSVVHRARELEVELPASGLIEKWASGDWNAHFQAHLEQRKSLLPRCPEARAVLDKLAAFKDETDPETMARALKTFDETTGLEKYYDRGLTDAYAATMDKRASGWAAEIDDHTLTESDLKKVAASGKLASYLGAGFASEFAKHPIEIFESLPETEKVLVKQLATGEA